MNDPVIYFLLHHYLLLFFGVVSFLVVGCGLTWSCDESLWLGIPTLVVGILLWADFILRIFAL